MVEDLRHSAKDFSIRIATDCIREGADGVIVSSLMAAVLRFDEEYSPRETHSIHNEGPDWAIEQGLDQVGESRGVLFFVCHSAEMHNLRTEFESIRMVYSPISWRRKKVREFLSKMNWNSGDI